MTITTTTHTRTAMLLVIGRIWGHTPRFPQAFPLKYSVLYIPLEVKKNRIRRIHQNPNLLGRY